MAKHILYNASIVLNSVDLSDHDNKVEFTVETNGQAAAAMSEVEDYEMPSTRKVSPLQLELYQDFAASKVYQTLVTLWQNRTTFNAVVKADAGANATTNPAFTVPVFIKSMNVINGSRGDAHMTSITLQPAGVMTIATS